MNVEHVGAGIIALLTLIGTLYNAYLSQKAKNHIKKVPNEIKLSTEHNIKIQEEITKLKETLNADRVLIFDFHNGEHYSNGRGASKISATFETTKPNIKSIALNWLNIPLSLFNNRIDKLITDKKHFVKDIEEINVDNLRNSYQIKKEDGIQSFYDYALVNTYNEPIGFIEVQYVDNKYTLKEEDIKELERVTYIISYILEDIRKEQI